MAILNKITGFTKTSNTIWFFSTAVVFALFCVSQIMYLRRGGWLTWAKPVGPGEIFHFSKSALLTMSIQVHMWSVLPAGILLPLQFLPIVRRKYINFHKLAGRLLFILLIIGNITALGMGWRSFGGSLETQSYAYLLATGTTLGIYKSWTSIRDLRLDEHRVWALRTWAWAGSILALRIVMIPMIFLVYFITPRGYKYPFHCEELLFMTSRGKNATQALSTLPQRYPACANLTVPGKDVWVVVDALIYSPYTEERTALINLVFGASGLVGFFVVAFFLEVYLNGTKDEDERLKKVSAMKRKTRDLNLKGKAS